MLSGDIKNLELIKRTFPLLKKHGNEIGEKMYKKMFDEHPDVKKLFANTPPGQAQRLIDTILLYCEMTDSFADIYDKLDHVAHVHIKAGVKNEYYPWMKKAFVSAVREVLKDRAMEDIVAAWQFGFDNLSAELIHAENLIWRYQSK